MWAFPVPAGEPGLDLYGFPHLDGDRGVKAAIYRDGGNLDVDPDTINREVADVEHERVRQLLGQAIPALAGARTDSTVCMYAGVADDDFVLGLHPGSSGRMVVAVGFSGHGFKFVPVVGEIVADLVIEGTTRHEIDFLSPDRVAAH
jgi:sarcosine oxidase